MADAWGTVVYLLNGAPPRWDQARAFQQAWNTLVNEDDGVPLGGPGLTPTQWDRYTKLLDRFVPAKAGFLNLDVMLDCALIEDVELTRLQDCVDGALAHTNPFVSCMNVGPHLQLIAEPETNASDFMEIGWQTGLLGAAGLVLSIPDKTDNPNSPLEPQDVTRSEMAALAGELAEAQERLGVAESLLTDTPADADSDGGVDATGGLEQVSLTLALIEQATARLSRLR